MSIVDGLHLDTKNKEIAQLKARINTLARENARLHDVLFDHKAESSEALLAVTQDHGRAEVSLAMAKEAIDLLKLQVLRLKADLYDLHTIPCGCVSTAKASTPIGTE